ncbi:sensor histidine kinase [Streptomyces poriferorum]|uniref:histidine kinase n=1 Tax=Streptomyces poriferorum TaxID=2798799 RepID=A0ABY9IIP4_9ACTN|nr:MULTISPECIES: ATP-binding protein [unclassified Streptomyces]MDP5316444.1 ATP-binding protein [Streptomyces sp. Alt4]WLQ54759.1 ATP-binding protein [Streptomyces sp. Alt2]
MSQLRAPDARPERREGGRHGRPGPRSHSAAARPRAARPSPEARIRPQLLRTAVLPAVAVALAGTAAVIFTARSGGVRPSRELWTALGAAGALAAAAMVAAFLAANRVATTVLGRCLALRRTSVQGQADLQRVVEQLRNGEPVPARRTPQAVAPGSDPFELLAQELGRQQDGAVAAVVQASRLSRLSEHTGEDQKVEVFVNLARRLQSLVHREIQLLDELEHQVEDPDLLKGLFHVDHLATRIRRHAENLAVLGGAVSRRQWSNPVTMTEVLRSAIAEVEQYPRVKLVPPIDGTLRGHAVADVIHLLAELVENATVFSAPQTQVLLRAQRVTAGLALEVEDRGLGMPGDEQKRMNALLADPDQVNVARLLQDGRIGLFVVASLARRHGIAVRLQSNIYGGTQAVLVLPQTLLGADEDAHAEGAGAPAPPLGPVHRPPPTDDSAGRLGPAPERAAAPEPERRPYVPQQQQLRLHQAPQRTPRQGDGPPLPLRAERLDRPAPADARSGIPTTDDAVPALPQETGVVRGTMGRPQLPRRANQEHLVPQLREAPAPRAEEEPTLHDPGLVAAFRRGIDLAEARQESEADPVPDGDTGSGASDGTGADAGGSGDLRTGRERPAPVRAPLEPLPVRGAVPVELLRAGSYHSDQDPLEANVNTTKE